MSTFKSLVPEALERVAKPILPPTLREILNRMIFSRLFPTPTDTVGYETFINFMEERKMMALEGDIIEIGCFVGGGTAKFAKFARKYGKKVYAIDIFDINFDQTRILDGRTMSDLYYNYLRHAGKSQMEIFEQVTRGLDNIVVIKEDSKKVKLSADEKIVFGFIDGCRDPDYVISDFYLVWDHLVPNGAVALHDYKGDLPQTTHAIESLIAKHRNHIQVLEIPSKLTVILVKKDKS